MASLMMKELLWLLSAESCVEINDLFPDWSVVQYSDSTRTSSPDFAVLATAVLISPATSVACE